MNAKNRMHEALEQRLRVDLATIDDVPVSAPAHIATAGQSLAGRRGRNRRIMVVGLCSVLFVGTGGGLWWTRDRPSELASGDNPEMSASVATSQPQPTLPPDSTPQITPADPVTTDTVTTAPIASGPTTIETSPAAIGSWRHFPPDPRGNATQPAAVWTGREVLVTGGVAVDGQPVFGATAYDPTTDTWRTLADPPEHSGRINELVVWTGSEMLVIGGDNPDGSPLAPFGTAYDPETNRWRIIESPPGVVSNRSPSAWDGVELLVWPSDVGDPDSSAAPTAYWPMSDIWRPLAQPPIDARQEATSIWTGVEWIVWGGANDGVDGTHVEFADGAAYDLRHDRWRTIAESPLSARVVQGVWTGAELLIDAGRSGTTTSFAHADGAAYDPLTDAWRPITPGFAHPGFVPLFTGSHLLLFAKGSVAVYDVVTDRWIDTCCSGGGATGTAVWTGTEAVVIGSFEPDQGGAAFTPPTSIATECSADDVDVSTESAMRDMFFNVRPWTRDGCAVRSDVLAHVSGAAHCEWERVQMIWTAPRIGDRIEVITDAAWYVRDPDDAMGFSAGFELGTALPPGATDTGYRWLGTQLWSVPDDPSAIFLIYRDRTERWPRVEPLFCA